MSATEFKELPALLRRAQVLEITGWSKRNYYEMVEAKKLDVLKLPGFREQRVRTFQLARLLGLPPG